MITTRQLPEIDILAEAGDWPSIEGLQGLVEKAILAAVDSADLRYPRGAEISIVLSDNTHMRALNRQWRKIDKPTNVLSFPAGDMAPGEQADMLLGDIVFAIETIGREAAETDKTFEDHLSHLVIHGFLHIFGYDHLSDQDAEEMENLEQRALARLGIANPYEEAL